MNDTSLDETVSAVRKAKAMNALKLLQRESAKNASDKMTLEEINAEIKTARENKKNKTY